MVLANYFLLISNSSIIELLICLSEHELSVRWITCREISNQTMTIARLGPLKIPFVQKSGIAGRSTIPSKYVFGVDAQDIPGSHGLNEGITIRLWLSCVPRQETALEYHRCTMASIHVQCSTFLSYSSRTKNWPNLNDPCYVDTRKAVQKVLVSFT